MSDVLHCATYTFPLCQTVSSRVDGFQELTNHASLLGVDTLAHPSIMRALARKILSGTGLYPVFVTATVQRSSRQRDTTAPLVILLERHPQALSHHACMPIRCAPTV